MVSVNKILPHWEFRLGDLPVYRNICYGTQKRVHISQYKSCSRLILVNGSENEFAILINKNKLNNVIGCWSVIRIWLDTYVRKKTTGQKKRRKNQWIINQPITTKNQWVKNQAQKKRSKPVDKKPEWKPLGRNEQALNEKMFYIFFNILKSDKNVRKNKMCKTIRPVCRI